MAAHPVRARRIDARVVVLCVLLVAALLAWFGADYLRDRLATGGCDTTTPVRVTASPDIAPVLASLARTVPERDCYTVDVTAAPSAATAAALEANGATGPDVWVPESSTWLLRARDGGAWNLPESGQSVASSPVVLALTDDVAKHAGWPGKAPSWADVLAGSPVGLPDPNRDPAAIAALIGLRQLATDAPDPAAAFTEEIRRLSAVQEPFTASPASEQSVLARKLVAAYPAAGVPGFDYPYVVLPRASEASRSAAERFLRLLLDQTATAAFGNAGFRTPSGQLLGDRQAGTTRTDPAPRPAGPPAPDAMYGVLQAWAGANLSARVQVLLDVSGSMAATVPGTGRSRMALTLEAATQGLGLFKPTTEIGLWLFSTRLDGDKDYRELLPMRPLSQQLAAGGLAALQAVKPKPGGATGLYDSILAAYQNARQNWQLGRINVVVVLTDGRNEDSDSVGLPGLLAELGRLQDPRKPLPVIGIGIGPDIDASELQQVSAATGGESFSTPDPRKISDVFYQALSKLMCQPPACKN
ncbi:substrate-binding domain-containing protein [Amycolatopsis australiensis]|uniref:von Willebrand factor type A domain-containing protein n=1 Tax=Amycolatopsis australiensis TaxID=546364 RepID=A0A1K1RD32_9PSEU|nr:substrate-binding domain-containing protein [Amycolatopsis australiensis]SFW69723.1 von Willebrand factor type A domain-containing protein [Amycolatopsis australiensis]